MSSNGKKWPQYIAAFVAAGGALAAGTMLGWTNPVESKVMGGSFGFSVNDAEFSWIGAALPLGAAVACIPSGFMVDGIGRQMSTIYLVIPFGIGWLLIVFAVHIAMLYVGRAVLGVACGATCVSVPIYTGEIAQKEIRGTLGSFFQLLINCGILLVYVVGAFSDPTTLTMVCAALTMVYLVFMSFMPESPPFLISKGADEKAAKALSWLRGNNYDLKEEMEAMKADDIKNKEQKTSFFAGFKSRACFRALYISLGLMFFQQFSGINAIIFYSTTIFRLSGSSLEPRFATIIIGVLIVTSTLFAVFFVDKLGRRLLLLLSAAIMSLSTFVLGLYFYFYQNNPESVQDFNWLPITVLCVFIVMFSIGFGPVPWIMVGELFPPNVKGTAGSLAGTSNWLMAFIVSKTYVDLEGAIGTGATFWLFACITVLGFFFVLIFVPETKGKSLSEIQVLLSDTK